MKAPTSPTLRCAIYTRVSTEHGLEQEFNSLDNQREAAEAYVKSQAHEGWRCLAGRYDDGGFSGGLMERPALQALLKEIQARRIDVVVVDKVDRLTRSLADFAKLVELFDEHGVSFVSVTQPFNTTSSMGRLTLNVLLSFAQFEREVTGERIRDKIAASKSRGMWMGGVVPLGYRVENRALHIVEEHAALIRVLYARYLEIGSVTKLCDELAQTGVTVPMRIDGKGRTTGGKPFSRGHLYLLLSSPIYVGHIAHKGRVHAGLHMPIVDPETFDAVQQRLAQNGHQHRSRTQSSTHLLTGRIRDEHGQVMSPTHTAKGSRRYRYYVSAPTNGQRPKAVTRIAACEIEGIVLSALRSASRITSDTTDAALVAERLNRITVNSDLIEIELADEQLLQVPWSKASGPRRREIIAPTDAATKPPRPMKTEDRTRILGAIAQGRCWLEEITTGATADAIASRQGCTERNVRNTLLLAFLSPTIVSAIIDGRLPRGIGLSRLADLPSSWVEQHQALGI